MLFVSKKKYEKLEKEKLELEERLNRKIKNKKALEEVNQQLEIDKEILNTDLLKVMEENNELKRSKQELEKELNDSALKISELSTKLLNEQQSKGAYKGRITTLLKENERLESDLVDARKIIEELEKKVRDLKSRPTLSELKMEKANKVEMNKIIGSKKRGK